MPCDAMRCHAMPCNAKVSTLLLPKVLCRVRSASTGYGVTDPGPASCWDRTAKIKRKLAVAFNYCR